MNRKFPQWLPALAWITFIFITSSSVVTTTQLAKGVAGVSAGSVTNDEFRHIWAGTWWLFVKGWHATEFSLLYLFCSKGFKRHPMLALAIPLLYAVADELHQLFVPHRGCRASDVCIDWLGVLATWAYLRFRPKPAYAFLFGGIALGAIYLLSVYPFGLIELPEFHTGGTFNP